MIIVIGLIIVGVIIGIGFAANYQEVIVAILLSASLLVFFIMFIVIAEEGCTYSDGVKDTLNHKNNYKINYQKVNDSTFIPIDTVIIYK